jgi:heparinase II/III-like protein
MLDNVRALPSLLRHFGWRWLAFRLGYAFRLRSGIIRGQIPAYDWGDKPLASWLKAGIPSAPGPYAAWRKQDAPVFFFRPADPLPKDVPWNPAPAVEEAERLLTGEFRYFGGAYFKVGCPPDWTTDPVSGIRLDPRAHWSQIPDFGAYDIKFVWEASRFSGVYALVRANAHRPDERYAEAFWSLIEDWAAKNPPNRGPNWKDGQEAALRVMAWCFGLYGFQDSPPTTPERVAQLTVMIAAHARRIFQNIDYAISTRSNHTISEAFGLWLAGCLFPELKDAGAYLSLGRDLLEKEAAQILPDGSYSMYSLNYHRFVLQLYLCALRLGEINRMRFSDSLYRSLSASVDHLYQLIEPGTGEMPAYGSNDGALVLPLDGCDFTDYRPVLQLGYYLLHGKRLFESGPWDEDLYWLCGAQAMRAEVVSVPQTSQSFQDGGVYILRSGQSKAVLRCTDYRARPSHADQLHADLWWRGRNIACDAGTYLYNGPGIWRNGLARTGVHNTVTVDDQDQMRSLSRFTWVDWARGRTTGGGSFSGVLGWQGEHNGYLRLADPARHKRTVLMLDEARWLVVDHLDAAHPHHYRLHWLINDFPYTPGPNSITLQVGQAKLHVQLGSTEGNADFSIMRADPDGTRGWRSLYYGQKQPALSLALETDRARACFWTYFGLEGDALELEGHDLNIVVAEWQAEIDLLRLDSKDGLSQIAVRKESR